MTTKLRTALNSADLATGFLQHDAHGCLAIESVFLNAEASGDELAIEFAIPETGGNLEISASRLSDTQIAADGTLTLGNLSFRLFRKELIIP